MTSLPESPDLSETRLQEIERAVRNAKAAVAVARDFDHFDTARIKVADLEVLLSALTAARAEREEADDALELAWGIIANAGGGNWTRENPDWQEAAARWRDRVMPALSARAAIRARSLEGQRDAE